MEGCLASPWTPSPTVPPAGCVCRSRSFHRLRSEFELALRGLARPVRAFVEGPSRHPDGLPPGCAYPCFPGGISGDGRGVAPPTWELRALAIRIRPPPHLGRL